MADVSPKLPFETYQTDAITLARRLLVSVEMTDAMERYAKMAAEMDEHLFEEFPCSACRFYLQLFPAGMDIVHLGT